VNTLAVAHSTLKLVHVTLQFLERHPEQVEFNMLCLCHVTHLNIPSRAVLTLGRLLAISSNILSFDAIHSTREPHTCNVIL
jgi:hypothetical protein